MDARRPRPLTLPVLGAGRFARGRTRWPTREPALYLLSSLASYLVLGLVR